MAKYVPQVAIAGPRPARSGRRTALILAAALLCLPGAARAERPHFDSLFWQPDLSQGFGDPQWVGAELDRAARAGVTTIVVQWLGHGDQILLDRTVGGRDPVQVLLDEAQARGMSVWLGTWENPAIWRTRQIALPAWRRAMVRGTELAATAAQRYGEHPALAGWYYTPEAVWWRPPTGWGLERFTATTAEAVARLKRLTGHPVAIVLGPSGRGEANLLPISWCRYIEGSRPDVVVAMDGVGTAHLDVLLAPALYRVLHRCAERAGATLWADVEVFGPDGATPDLGRLWTQYDAARAGAGHVTAFDQPHHLRPGTVAARFWDGERPASPVLAREPLTSDPPNLSSAPHPQLRRGTVDATLADGPRRVGRVEVVLRREATSVTIDGLTPDGGLFAGGEAQPSHGPGRDEWTWTLELPATAPLLRGAKVRVQAARYAVDVLDVRLIAAP